MNALKNYLNVLGETSSHSESREGAYRSALADLICSLVPEVSLDPEDSQQKRVTVINEPGTKNGNKPDLVVKKGDHPVCYIETKDLGKDLDDSKDAHQFERYQKAFESLIITNYLEFRFFQKGILFDRISIGKKKDKEGKVIVSQPKAYQKFSNLLIFFCSRIEPIKTPEELAKKMAITAGFVREWLIEDIGIKQPGTPLHQQYEAFKSVLIPTLKIEEFADMYAQTLVYGMFVARIHNEKGSFTRSDAVEFLPKSNPFLKDLFPHIVNSCDSDRIRKTLDVMVELLNVTDVDVVRPPDSKKTGLQDPMIHFYETFLATYDKTDPTKTKDSPGVRREKGVWYTPKSVVRFIVRAVDHILKEQFGLIEGLKDNSKVEVDMIEEADSVEEGAPQQRIKKVIHKVQILDPAVGTGNFLIEIIEHLHENYPKSMLGTWPEYVAQDLIPRLHGFEILMPPYIIAHLNIALHLKALGYESGATDDPKRLNVYLTDALQPFKEPTAPMFFANFLSKESNDASRIKAQTPLMVVLGNPPYKGHSTNTSEWIEQLLEPYKCEPGGTQRLKERNPKWINDDYVKFISLGQDYVNKNKEGVLAFINNHAFLQNPTFRGMRWQLLRTFDEIYVLDLHGNLRMKADPPPEIVDKNVFDIGVGVSINIFVKTGKKKPNELAKVHYHELWGSRESKFEALDKSIFRDLPFKEVKCVPPHYFFVPKDIDPALEEKYAEGFSIKTCFEYRNRNSGIKTSKDEVFIANTEQELRNKIQKEYDVCEDELIKDVSYRPFDTKKIYYDTKKLNRARLSIMRHFFSKKNVGLCICRQVTSGKRYQHVFITNEMIDMCLISNKSRENGYVLPLYTYLGQDSYESPTERKHNLNKEVLSHFSERTKLTFVEEIDENDALSAAAERRTFAPIDVLDYIYATLHAPAFRARYAELLIVDFPRIPYPKEASVFWKLVEIGAKIREIHLMKETTKSSSIGTYPVPGTGLISRSPKQRVHEIDDQKVRIYINDQQYFDNVPRAAWEFYIGCYQPAQKWLQDRYKQTLKLSEVLHYQQIIVSLDRTHNLMQEDLAAFDF